MAQRKIVWSHKASLKLFSILEFYAKRNLSIAYSKKLYNKFGKEVLVLFKQPGIGLITDV
jgi:hypothetical protein